MLCAAASPRWMGSFSLPMRLIGGKSSAIVPRKETKTPVVISAGALRAFQAKRIITVQSAAMMVISTTGEALAAIFVDFTAWKRTASACRSKRAYS